MNVWIVNHYAIPPSMGGLVRHYYFSKYLQKKGHSVKIFTSSKIHNTDINMIRDKSLYREEMEDGVEYTFVRSRDYKGNGMDRVINMMDLPFKTWKAMKRFYKKEKPDVIYTSSPDLFVALFALLFGRKHKIPVVVEVRDLWPESIVEYNGMSRMNPIIQVLYQLEKWIYVHADQLIFTMPGGKEYICDKGWTKKVNINKVNHVNNGVDLAEFEENKKLYNLENSQELKKLAERNGETYTSFPVPIIERENLESIKLDRTQSFVKMQDIHFYIYGDGTEKDMLEDECRKYSLNVKFEGRVEKKYIPYILSNADLNIINVQGAGLNKYGCSWNKLFEYMASEKPILCNLPVNYDLIREKKLGIAKRFANGKEYAEEITKFRQFTSEEYGEYCQRLKECAQEYDYQILTNKIERILKKAIDSSKR